MTYSIDAVTRSMSHKSNAYRHKAVKHKARFAYLKKISRLSHQLFISDKHVREAHKMRILCCILLSLFTHLLITHGVVSSAIGGPLIAIYIASTIAWIYRERADRAGHAQKIYALISDYPAKDKEAKFRLLKLYHSSAILQPDDFTDWLSIEFMALMH